MTDHDDKTRIALLEQAVTELRLANDRQEALAQDIAKHLRVEAVQSAEIRGILNRMAKYETQCDLCRVQIAKLERDLASSSASRKTAVAMVTLLVAMAAGIGSLVSILLGKA